MGTTDGLISGTRSRQFDVVGERVRRIAGGLRRLGIRPGDCVCILMRNDLVFIEVTYAIMLIGAYAVPINWHFKPEEVAYVVGDTGAGVLVGHADLLQALGDAIPDRVRQFRVDVPQEIATSFSVETTSSAGEDFEAWLADQKPYDGPSMPAPASMIYTSGTTGHPKGVRRDPPSPDQVKTNERVRETVYGLRPGTRALLPGPLYHSAPNAFALRAGRLGGALVLMPRFEAESVLALIEKERIDCALMVPTMFVRLLRLPQSVRAKYDLSSLRHVVHAAAPCPPDVKRQMLDWWGPVIYEYYGSTESGAITFATPDDARRKPGTVGRVLDGCELRFSNGKDGWLSAGEVGEIYSRTSYNPDFTYQNQPERRREIERDGLITSGDVGYIDQDGYVFISDRKRDVVISGGVNIYPAEIEAALQSLPGVHDCAVFGIPDDEFGEALMAVIQPIAGTIPDLNEIRAGLKSMLSNYKVPKYFEIMSSLPREDSGKIFKRRLRDPYWQKSGRSI
ncbi:long-chain fatty acid--CoA ligase [Bradyrhizobium sp. NAS80.1]|uniref:acyl-CoA synthetase n=1 Tax=Bradyrhizobium sp. NAS80.1 TaxID=1680159 RepID=UPI000961A36A|nr:acyl-CoA synthetase [Bradyrhizobium sp. NAS80.1]OKO85308.1 long-chain fatty acid--CoA ligase [Bradyrhizobium sp. NAS80.1]